VKLKVNVDELLNWGRFGEQMSQRTPAAIARALNAYGEGVAKGAAQRIAEKTGIDINTIAETITIKRATPDDLKWSMDASMLSPPDARWSRPWESRNEKAFEQDTLVNIITVEDDCVCEACEEAASKGPYTMAEVRDLQAKWADFVPKTLGGGVRTNLIHPNCRCTIQSWKSLRKVPVMQQGTPKPGAPPPQKFTVRQLGQLIASEIRTEIKAVKGKR
jgi:hypothetical protein